MKTYEIKTSRSRWTSILIAVLLIVMVAMLCMPYFNYGDPASAYAPADGNAAHLAGKWIISGTEAGNDGYKEIVISEDGKTMTVGTTNIIRVQQIAADEAFDTAVSSYADVVAAVEGADIASQKVVSREAALTEVHDYIAGFTADMVNAEGLSFEYFVSEIEQVEVEIPEGAPVVLDAEAIAAIQADADKSYTKLSKNVADAKSAYQTALDNLALLQAAVTNAGEGAKKAYEADASYAWVTEDLDRFNAAFAEANPEVRETIVNDNAKAVEAFEAATNAYNEALAKTNEAKAAYDAAKAEADAEVAKQKAAYDAAVKAGEDALAALKKQYDEDQKAAKAELQDKLDAYAAAIELANTNINFIAIEYTTAAIVSATAAEADAAAYNTRIAEYKAEKAAEIEAAKVAAQNAIADNEKKLADLKTAYEKNVADQQAADNKVIADAKAVYDEAAKGVEGQYADEKKEYQDLKKTSDALKKEIPSKVALYEEDEVVELVNEKAGTVEELDNNVYGKLAAEKAKAAEGYALCKDVIDESEDIVKAAEKAKKSAETALKNFDKELEKYIGFALQLNPEVTFDIPEATATANAIPELVVPEYEKNNEEPEMMVTEGKVKYNEKKGELTLTFANGDVINTTYSTGVEYNGVKELSVLGYVGFPYEVEDFTTEMVYKIPGFYINDVVLVPIILLVLAVIGVVFCFLKKDKMSAAYLPLAFSIIGLIGYAVSDFLKLGEKFSNHMIGFAIVGVISIIHILFSIKEKKAK